MNKTRRKFSAEFKAKVAIEALKEQNTVAELCQKHGIHAAQIGQWKRELLDNSTLIFKKESKNSDKKEAQEFENELEILHTLIGKQQVELAFLKKSLKKLEG